MVILPIGHDVFLPNSFWYIIGYPTIRLYRVGGGHSKLHVKIIFMILWRKERVHKVTKKKIYIYVCVDSLNKKQFLVSLTGGAAVFFEWPVLLPYVWLEKQRHGFCLVSLSTAEPEARLAGVCPAATVRQATNHTSCSPEMNPVSYRTCTGRIISEFVRDFSEQWSI
jgi:hypothetical protein